ncbi:MAG: MgtC/SapB family protein [Pseudomonadota bacterium]
MNEQLFQYQHLAVALALGLLIGIERGWEARAAEEGSRVAGIRTFGLISLLGALWQLLAKEGGAVLLGLSFTAFAVLLVAGSYLESKRKREYGITTPVAALITFALGALAMAGHLALAAATAVITVILLDLKPVLHGWLRRLEPYELSAVFKLLLISVVLLPILPDRAFDPWDVLNPYEIWWMVVLISAISFIGYFAIKIAGPQRGVVLTGLFGGLASSTAVTLSLSRLGRKQPWIQQVLAAGVTVSAATMFPRILVIAGLIQPGLLKYMAMPLGAMCLTGYLGTWWLIKHCTIQSTPEAVDLKNPFELGVAVQFGILLGIILLLTKILQESFGETGLYILSGISGITDVDAITLSLSRLTHVSTVMEVATNAIILAAIVNTVVKAILVFAIAGGVMAKRVATVFMLMIMAGIAGLMPVLLSA